MFSKKVMCAVDVIRILNESKAEKKGVNRAEITSRGCMDRLMYKLVIADLAKCGLVERKSSGRFVLIRDINSLSLYDLTVVFHRGVIIGEPVSYADIEEILPAIDSYQSLIVAENKLSAHISNLLKEMKLSKFIQAQY